jgi:hypothetical protein
VALNDKEELYRRLAQARRMVDEPVDPLTKERLKTLIRDIERDLAAAEARDADAPPE